MKEKLQSDLKTAMKGGEEAATDDGARHPLRDYAAGKGRLSRGERRQIIQIIKRERARRDESLEFARRGKRYDLITQYETEAKILEGYLPEGVGEAELNAAVSAQIMAGANQIGPIMKALRDQSERGWTARWRARR